MNMADGASTASSQAQLKLQLNTRHSDISLPENTGPILVNTSMIKLPFQYVH